MAGTGERPAPAGGGDEAGRDPGVPRPPSREELDLISADQALITDEWADEGPPGDGRAPERQPGDAKP